MDGYIRMAVCKISSLKANVLKINFGCPPTNGSVFTNSHFSRGEQSCARTGKQQGRTKPPPCKSSRASWQTQAPKSTQNTLRTGGNNYKETSTNYQRPSLILYSTFSWKYSFQDIIQKKPWGYPTPLQTHTHLRTLLSTGTVKAIFINLTSLFSI